MAKLTSMGAPQTLTALSDCSTPVVAVASVVE